MAAIRRIGYVAVIGGALALTFSMWSHVGAQTAEQEVMKAEQARVDARRKADSAALARLVADDLTQITAAGGVQQKKYVVSLAAAPKLDQRALKTQTFADIAVVTGIQTGIGTTAPELRFTHVWQRRNGQWVNVFVHNTTIRSGQQPATQAATPNKLEPTSWPKGSNQDERQVLDTHRRIDEAFAKKDVAAYSALTAANWVRLNRDGTETSREAFLKDVAGTPEQKRVVPNHSEINMRIYGPIAVVTYLSKPVTGPQAGIRRSRVFVKEGATWKQLVSQETDVALS